MTTLTDTLYSTPAIHPKGWGHEEWIANSALYCGKILVLEKGKKCSIHEHKLKDETFYILEGKVQIDMYPEGYPGRMERKIMTSGVVLHIPPLTPHQFYGIEDSRILEISTQHFEEDSYRHVKGD